MAKKKTLAPCQLLIYFQSFIASLATEQKDSLLLELLSNGRGSLDYAKNMVSGDQGPEIAPSIASEWCICGVCQPMQTPEEDKCCANQQCATSYELFCNICLNREVLSVAIRARCDIRVEEPDYESNSYRKAAFRLYIVWRFGKLGWDGGNRKVCPSCVVLVVRRSYSASDGQYMGFCQSQDKQHLKGSGNYPPPPTKQAKESPFLGAK